jgi:tRNA(Ile)-lysidine synthase
MRARDGRLVRPLLEVDREQTAAHNTAHGLPWREDPTNDSGAFARNRVRHGLLAELRAVHPAAEANLLRTLELLRDEAEVLDAAVSEALADARDDVAALAALAPALRRLVLRRLAGDASAAGTRADEILALGRGGGSAALDLGGGLRAVVEYGRLRFERAGRPAPAPAPTVLAVPGSAAFGAGRLSSERGPALPIGDGTLDAATLADTLEVRGWRAGDRMRPLGLEGSRSLQDLFTDRRVPRARRAAIPVVVSAGEIAWVPGVATGARFRVSGETRERVRLAWHP